MSTFSLSPLANYTAFPGPLVMVVMDGVGIGKKDASDGVHVAHTPVLDALAQEPLFAALKAHGTAVGQPSDDDMGNSEVGHNAIGAGRIFAQGAKLVNEAIATKRLFDGAAWQSVRKQCQDGGCLHFIGLLSDGNVHSNISQLLDMLDQCAAEGLPKARVHILTDGRDVGERSALPFIETLETKLSACSEGGRDYRIASGGGRMKLTMDRYEASWGMVEKGWNTHVLGEGRQFASAAEAVQTYYDEDPNVNDQYLDEFIIAEKGAPIGTIEDGDAVVLMNFRGDRAIELSRAFEDAELPHFDRKRVPKVFYAGIMQYDGDQHIPKNFLVEPPQIDGTMSEYFCEAGITSYAVSETQKFGHVTYFWNGNKSGYVDEKVELYEEIPSDDVPFEQRPWMKAAEITDAVLAAIQSGKHKFIRLNYPNGDMVGHTGVSDAVRIAVSSVDLMLARLIPAIEAQKGMLIITADHGNADLLYTEKKGVRANHMAHTLNPVPLIIKDYASGNRFTMAHVESAGLSNIAATTMNLLGYQAPGDYDPSLVRIGG
jgi:2,3-bisphosphoglycerate-independent phosphoglycerate mutase